MKTAAHHLWALLLAVAVVVPAARGVWFDLPSTGIKCVGEEIHNSVVVVADYYAFYGVVDDVNTTVSPSISVQVFSPYGKELYQKEKVSHGKFGFTTTEGGGYRACFKADGDHQSGKAITVGIDWKTGVSTKDWESIARKEKIEGLDLELRKLQGAVKGIRDRMYNRMTKELEMRVVSNTTNDRVAWYSMSSLGLCIVVSFLQLLYLKRYFRKKKLI